MAIAAECSKLKRELNAANAEIEEKRKDVVWLATEKAKLEEQLMDTKNKHAVLVADVVLNEDRAERIKRLEEAGDALANTQTYDLLETVNWRKSKEAKP
jgi:predicted  nucleic acid-binding Zn-ribbon protein